MYTLGIHSVYTQCIHGINRNYRDFKLIFLAAFVYTQCILGIYLVYTAGLTSALLPIGVGGQGVMCSIDSRCVSHRLELRLSEYDGVLYLFIIIFSL